MLNRLPANFGVQAALKLFGSDVLLNEQEGLHLGKRIFGIGRGNVYLSAVARAHDNRAVDVRV